MTRISAIRALAPFYFGVFDSCIDLFASAWPIAALSVADGCL